MKNPQATIRDLALKLNISISTVSRALRNAPDVNPETKKAVLELAKKLHYEPNRVAQSLRIKKTNTIGVVVPEIAMHFFSSAISGIQEYAAKHDYSIMICQSMESLRTEKSNIHMLVSNRVDGLLISLSSETKDIEHLESLIAKQIPIVLFDRITDELDVSKVVVDDHNGAFRGVEHLIKTGCKRIAYIGGPDGLYVSDQRLRGYRDAIRNYNLELDEELIMHCRDFHNDPTEAARTLLNRPNRPDAIFCMNDPVAILAMQVLKEKGIAIPNEVSLVGFTNEPVSQFIEPSLTTIAQPAYLMGQSAAKLFIEQMDNKEDFKPITKVLPTELIIRNSTKRIN
ncbi:MAG TPA: LacI family DNA-binding transcriptional regulator [Ohtaekwangia sp.]|uniref:LacI family DNA-binding transcriptional regulator n=1 Tax=Ohtaekwangia sp. TaxID=2066019 RepID=UPI002F94BED3